MEQAKGRECESRKSSNFMPGIEFIKYSEMLLPVKPGSSSFVSKFPTGLGGDGVEGESRTGFLLGGGGGGGGGGDE